ncbi:hypothetical protein KCU64_g3361, partial [Aureobasidium melanogenum]
LVNYSVPTVGCARAQVTHTFIRQRGLRSIRWGFIASSLPRIEGSDDVVGVTVDNTPPPEDLPINAENKLRVLYSASEISETIQASDIPSITRAEIEPPLPRKRVGKQGQTAKSAQDMLDWMSHIIKSHYRKELDEAKAKHDGSLAVLQPTEAQRKCLMISQNPTST